MKIEVRKLLNSKMPRDSIKINIEYNTSQKEEVDNLIKYINRLSDALYAIARYSEDKLIPMEF